jgi:hypothetical protein
LFLDLFKKIQGFPAILVFSGISWNYFYRKNYGSGLWITGPWLALDPWWTNDHGAVQPL